MFLIESRDILADFRVCFGVVFIYLQSDLITHNSLALYKRQAIRLANDDLIYCVIYLSLGGGEATYFLIW